MVYFPEVRGKVKYEGAGSDNPLAFKYYNAKKKVGGKTMEQHLKFAVCYWHTFKGTGADPFGGGVYDRPWEQGSDAMEVALKVCDFAKGLTKPLLASFIGLVGQPGEAHMETHGVPVYEFPELAVQGLAALAARGAFEDRLERGRYRPYVKPQSKGSW